MRLVVDNYNAILATLESICNSDSSECGSKAAGLQRCLNRFSTYFSLKLGISVFEQAEELSCLLQSKRLPASAAKHAASALVVSLNSSRKEQNFDVFRSSSTTEANNLITPLYLLSVHRLCDGMCEPSLWSKGVWRLCERGKLASWCCQRQKKNSLTTNMKKKLHLPLHFSLRIIDARRQGSEILILAGCADEKGIEHPSSRRIEQHWWFDCWVVQNGT